MLLSLSDQDGSMTEKRKEKKDTESFAPNKRDSGYDKLN